MIMQDKYMDIIEMEHHTSLKYPRMSMDNRAAQFSPFKALTGLDDAIDETAYNSAEKILHSEHNEIFIEAP